MNKYRFVVWFYGVRSVGKWCDFDMSTFLRDCEAWASNGVQFEAEFSGSF